MLANDSWSGQDKAQHFIASAMLSAAGNEYSRRGPHNRPNAATSITTCQFAVCRCTFNHAIMSLP